MSLPIPPDETTMQRGRGGAIAAQIRPSVGELMSVCSAAPAQGPQSIQYLQQLQRSQQSQNAKPQNAAEEASESASERAAESNSISDQSVDVTA